ncbi:hypothetical protein GCK72_016948 [Caenorhabditis remanei]|uniref:UPF3 domain-containing protein n=1 Tax=Caenorhabditis remanei TaxID=31234 RepID=A0A6A5G5U1_CAERE|nr:hypothetical protein GCK72_016948 [Caenorhabditis remanei]KAF1750398.1 hypothetical protein GCK72_016948 [Caenorhabditis remanei]
MSTEKSDEVKVMLRRLPKYMTEKEVMEQISPLPEEVIGTYFYPANFAFDHASYASLALVFSEYCDSLIDFERRFDGYIFVDSRGNDSSAVVEAAVNQNFSKCDRGRMTEDTRVGAILNDKYFLEFCEKLNLEKAVPIMTLEQQIRKLNQPEDARTQIDRLETPLVKYFIDKEYRRRSDYDVRRAKRELKKAEKHKNVMEFLMKPAAASGAPTTTSSGGSRRLQKASEDGGEKATNRVMTEKEKEKLEKIEARRKERNAIRKQKFLEEKKRKMEETSEGGIQNPQKKLQKPPVEKIQKAPRPPRGEKPPKKSMKPPRPSPAKTVGEQQGEDWIKKLTDPKAPIKKKHDLPVTTELKPSTTDQSAPPPPQRPRTAPTTTTRPPRHPKPPTPSKRPQTAPK